MSSAGFPSFLASINISGVAFLNTTVAFVTPSDPVLLGFGGGFSGTL